MLWRLWCYDSCAVVCEPGVYSSVLGLHALRVSFPKRPVSTALGGWGYLPQSPSGATLAVVWDCSVSDRPWSQPWGACSFVCALGRGLHSSLVGALGTATPVVTNYTAAGSAPFGYVCPLAGFLFVFVAALAGGLLVRGPLLLYRSLWSPC